jgi:hypothetical protein
LTFGIICEKIMSQLTVKNNMLNRNSSEDLQLKPINQYEINGQDFESRLQRIHNIIARHINVVIREITSEAMTNRARLYLDGGQEFIFYNFINQISTVIESTNLSQQQKLDFTRSLIASIASLDEMSQHMIIDCKKQVNLAQKDLNNNQMNAKILKVIRLVSKKIVNGINC